MIENYNFIETRYIDKLYNPENYENPLQEYEKNYYMINSKNILNSFEFNLKKMKFIRT